MISDFLRHVDNQENVSEYSSAYSLSPLSRSRAVTPRAQAPLPLPAVATLTERIKYSVIKSLLINRLPDSPQSPVV